MNADYREVAQALVDAGYVSDADAEAAADILADALIVEAAEEVEAEAMDDYSDQEDLIAEAVTNLLAELWVEDDDDDF